MPLWGSRSSHEESEKQVQVAKLDVSHHAFSSVFDEKEAKRIERMAESLSDDAPPFAAPYLKKAAPAVGIFVAGAEAAGPYIFQAGVGVYAVMSKLPTNALTGLWGLGICFYGGRYAAAIAAIEAFSATGGAQTMKCLHDIKNQAILIMKANAEDNKKDEDRDGVADVDQIEAKELAHRKMALVLKTVDPEVLSQAFGGLWAGYMGVLAVLKFKFAQTVALAHSIGDNLRPIAAKFFGPTILSLTPKDYRRWVNPAINFGCKMIAGYLAWKIQRVISTVQSGVSGGLIAARAALALMRARRLLTIADDETMLDEAAGYSLAAGGVYYQLVKGGPVPFMLKPIFWPMDIVEWWLQWSVTWMSTVSPDDKK